MISDALKHGVCEAEITTWERDNVYPTSVFITHVLRTDTVISVTTRERARGASRARPIYIYMCVCMCVSLRV